MKTLRKSLEDYLALRRGLGAKLHAEGVRLPKFVSFVEERKSSYITTRLALDWAQQTSGRYPIKRLTMVRGFAKYVSGFDTRTEVPPFDFLSRKFARSRPYIYSDEEIQHLLRAAWKYRRDKPRGTVHRCKTCHNCLGWLSDSGIQTGYATRVSPHRRNGTALCRSRPYSHRFMAGTRINRNYPDLSGRKSRDEGRSSSESLSLWQETPAIQTR